MIDVCRPLGGEHAIDGDGIDDILNAAAPGKVERRLPEPLDDRADGLGASETLGHLVTDITGIEVGKD